MTCLIPTVSIVDGTPRVSSLDIAEKFGKPHKDVLRVISRIVRDLDGEFTERNFAPSEYIDETGRTLPKYNLTRDAFSLVAMGFTGKAALAWKVRYIEAFNAMAARLLKEAAPALESEDERKRRLARERKRLQRERERNPLSVAPTHPALPMIPAVLDEHAQKVESAMSAVQRLANELIPAIFTLQSAMRFRRATLDAMTPQLGKSLERNLPHFGTAISMNVSALSDLLDVYKDVLRGSAV